MIYNFFSKKQKKACFAKVQRSKGFIVLTMVLLVSAVVLAVATGLLLRSISQANESGDSEKSLKAWAGVNACGEYAMGKLGVSNSYAGDETFQFGNETEICYIYPVEEDESGVRLVKASSTVSGFTKKVLIQVNANRSVAFWKEVADF